MMGDTHVRRSRKAHSCCLCREKIGKGDPSHTEAERVDAGRFVVRYYHPRCWLHEVLNYMRQDCRACREVESHARRDCAEGKA
jgi:hypothetical protein